MEEAILLGEKWTENRIKILQLMSEDPYISRAMLGIRNYFRKIEAMRGKYLHHVGLDKGGWEV